MGKRLNIWIPDDTWSKMHKIVTEYGFNSECELAKTIIRLCIARLESPEALANVMADDEVNEIDQMFSELIDYEPTPYNTDVPKIHRQKR